MKKSIKILAVFLLMLTLSVFAGQALNTNANHGYLQNSTAYAAVLKQGNTGTDVKTLQKKLKNWGYYTGAVDGIFGPKTKEAVKYFQRKNNLTVDGIVGKKTLAALGMTLSSGTTFASICPGQRHA